MRKIFFALSFLVSLFVVPGLCYGADPLPLERAFVFSTSVVSGNTVVAHWTIAPGYHLYRDRVSFELSPPSQARLGNIVLPAGMPKEDEILGKYQIYEGALAITVPIAEVKPSGFTLTVHYQGCADSGFCYPPITKHIAVSRVNDQLTLAPATKQMNAVAVKPASLPHYVSSSFAEQDKIARLLAGKNWLLILLGFFGFGLFLAFTPCVLPMIPILSGIIVGQGKTITISRAFVLSLVYVLAMAVTYAIAGIVAGLAGGYVQAFLQTPWVIGSFSMVFVLLALSLFGLYELRMPSIVHHHVTMLSARQSEGTYVGVAIMGCLSTLIVSPCVSAPLIGALSYIGRSGNATLGGIALFTLGLGMGLPLLIIGTMGGKFLPKVGAWMNAVKAIFGVLLLAVAILLLARIIPPYVTMLLWAGLLIVTAIYMGAFTTVPLSGAGKLWKGLSLIMLVHGFLLLIGAAMGNIDPFKPLATNQAIPISTISENETSFHTIKSIDDLQEALKAAKTEKKPVLVDFYADWCISCKVMERQVFTDPTAQAKMAQFIRLRVDVTADSDADRALKKYLNVMAPPTVVFFNSAGVELTSTRAIGEMDVKAFVEYLNQVIVSK